MHATIRLQIEHSKNAALVRKALPPQCQVILAKEARKDEGHSFDLGVLDYPTFLKISPHLPRWKSSAAPMFLPILLLCEADEAPQLPPQIWNFIDELVTIPCPTSTLQARIRLLLKARQSSVELQELNSELEQHTKNTPNPTHIDVTVNQPPNLQELLTHAVETGQLLVEQIYENLEPQTQKILDTLLAQTQLALSQLTPKTDKEQ